MDIKNLRTRIDKLRSNISVISDYEKGISVIIPVFDGIEYIERCLKSLINQRIIDAKFEVIIVLNGKYLNELEYLYVNEELFNKLDLFVLINDSKGASAARNLGIKNAKYSHLMFIDIDDYISLNYIQETYATLEKGTISITQIRDVIKEVLLPESPMNDQIQNYIDNKLSNYRGLNRILTITACKAVPKEYFESFQFRENLNSGEDTLLFTEIIVNIQPKIKIVPFEKDAVYYREIREDSVSRQETSFDFNIVQRIDILKILDKILTNVIDFDLKLIVKYKYNAQIVLMNKYLIKNPVEYKNVIKLVRNENLNNFSFEILNENLSETLIISYCAPPYSDTSASIVTKRIIENKKVVDIVSNRMDNIRGIDKTLEYLAKPFISTHIVNQKNASFSNFYFLSSYIDKVFQYYCENKEKYKYLYSRAMFPISNITPLFIKMINSNIHWTAEFSDPLLIDIESKKREAPMDYPTLNTFLESGVLGDFTEYVDNNMFNLSELIPFALADELVFTNTNQMNFMFERFPENIREQLLKKSIISSHPTLEEEYYDIHKTSYKYNKSVINIGYFGNFYSRRGINEILKIKEYFDDFTDSLIQIHVFTNLNGLTDEELQLLKLNNIALNNYVSYLEFLNLSKEMDILLLFDSITSDIKNMNPYLPSKLSDYIGSNSNILALVEKNSVMANYNNQKLCKVSFSDSVSDINNKITGLLLNVLKNKENYTLIDENNVTVIKHEGTLMSINHNLEARNQDINDFLVKPRELPIRSTRKYEFYIENNTNQTKQFKIKSFYSVKNIIKVKISSILTDYSYENCISTLRKSKDIIISPGDKYTFEIQYHKSYKKQGFIEAGRLLITKK